MAQPNEQYMDGGAYPIEPTPFTLGGRPVNGLQDIMAFLQGRGLPTNAANVSRTREAAAHNPDLLSGGASSAPSAPSGGSGGGGAPSGRSTPSVGKSAPSGGSVARAIEPRPQVSSDTAASGPQFPPRPQVSSDAAASGPQSTSGGNGNTSAQPTRSDSGYDPASLIGLLPSAAGIGAAALASRYGGGGSGGEFIGNSSGVPTGRTMDVPPEPLLSGPRAPQLGAPPSAQEAMIPETNPLQLALARAIEPQLPMGEPGIGGPQMGAPQLQAPEPRPPIPMRDSTSGPTIAASDQRPLMPSAGVQPGPTSPTQVGRTAGPAANPNAIVNPPVDASRGRNQILEYLSKIGRDVGGGARGRPVRVP